MFCARKLMHAMAFPFAAHASVRVFRFGASLASSSATWRSAKSQSGCLSCGSLLTNQRRQSATRHSFVAVRPTAASARLGALASQRTTARSRGVRHRCHALEPSRLVGRCAQAVTTMVCRHRPKSFGSVQNAETTNSQGSEAMAMPRNIKAAEVCVFSTPSPALRSLTGRSSGHQYLPASIGTLRAAHSGAAYLGR